MREHAGVYSRAKRRYLCCTKLKGMVRDEKSGTLVTLLCAMAMQPGTLASWSLRSCGAPSRLSLLMTSFEGWASESLQCLWKMWFLWPTSPTQSDPEGGAADVHFHEHSSGVGRAPWELDEQGLTLLLSNYNTKRVSSKEGYYVLQATSGTLGLLIYLIISLVFFKKSWFLFLPIKTLLFSMHA